MTVGLVDIYKKLKELIKVVDKVRENREEIKELKKSQEEMQANILMLMEGQQRILERLEYKRNFPHLRSNWLNI